MSEKRKSPLAKRYAALTVLALGLSGIVGVGCFTITRPAPKDERAVTEFLPKAKQGDTLAQYQMALSYRYGSSGLEVDFEQALQWMTRAAQAGQKDAQFAMGDMLLHPQGDRKADSSAALVWFRKAAVADTANALWLAKLLEQGEAPALLPNPQEARQLYRELAATNLSARFQLGRMAEKGVAEAPDLVAALVWYRLAQAPLEAERVERKLDPRQIARANQEIAKWKP